MSSINKSLREAETLIKKLNSIDGVKATLNKKTETAQVEMLIITPPSFSKRIKKSLYFTLDTRIKEATLLSKQIPEITPYLYLKVEALLRKDYIIHTLY